MVEIQLTVMNATVRYHCMCHGHPRTLSIGDMLVRPDDGLQLGGGRSTAAAQTNIKGWGPPAPFAPRNPYPNHTTLRDYKAMGGPHNGKYYILPAVDPKIIVGVDGVGNPWVPVVTDGKNNVVSPLVFALPQLRS